MHVPIALRSNRYTAGVTPSLGGALAWFGLAGDPLIEFVRATPVRALVDGNARMASSYPLVPYSNRVGDGRFVFDGAAVTLRRNTDISEHPVHGVGFQRSWDVVTALDNALTIALSHDGRNGADPDWPWSFDSTQSFDLDDGGLVISIAIVNRDTRRMPAGIGLHPFFPKSSTTQLRFETAATWMNDARMLPQSRIDVPSRFDFRAPRAVDELEVDNCFAGWTGTFELEWPERRWGLRASASAAFGHLVVFTGPLRDSIAIEPVSHVNNALNLARSRALPDDSGLVALAPGESLEGTMRLAPYALQALAPSALQAARNPR